MDVLSAFLHADVVSDIYMEQPEDYYTPSATGTRFLCKLDKALYNMREAPRVWNALGSFLLASPNHPLTEQSLPSSPPPYSTF
jgi:hypothetical protein